MPAKSLMILGTSSHAGKSVITAGFCRLFKQLGLKVAPFKAQNMSNNSFVTQSGGEMGRAQVSQAEAAGVEPEVNMNPVLLKPTSEQGSQVIVQGRAIGTMNTREYYAKKPEIWQAVIASHAKLAEKFDLIVMEGAGSPVEMNIKDNDIVNLPMALQTHSPSILVADIERGGVFAAIVGTYSLLTPKEKSLFCGTIINKFRGDKSLFTNGSQFLAEKTSVPVLGILPYLFDLRVDEEDCLSLDKIRRSPLLANGINLALIALPRLSNLTDFAPLWSLPGVSLRAVSRKEDLQGMDCIIIPGSKSTIQDLEWLNNSGMAQEISKLYRKKIPVLGICGGYQMLGKALLDPGLIEGKSRKTNGLDILEITTTYKAEKEKYTAQVKAHALAGHPFLPAGAEISGYEIHSGDNLTESSTPAHKIILSPTADKLDGSIKEENGCLAFGTYIHGLFDKQETVKALLDFLAKRKGMGMPAPSRQTHFKTASEARENSYNLLAKSLREELNLQTVFSALKMELSDDFA